MVSNLATATIVVSLLAAQPSATPTAPQWESDYGKALAATRADERPLLVVLNYPTDQTADDEAPAKDASGALPVSYSDESGAAPDADLLEPYQLCRIDVSTDYGKRVAEVFGVSSFPYTTIIDKTGSVIIYSKNGTLDTKDWESTLTTYKSGDRTESLVRTSRSNTSDVVFRKSSESNSGEACESCQRNYCPSCEQNQGY